MLLGKSLPIIDPIIFITYIKNTGAAFGIFKNSTLILALISIIFMVAMFLAYYSSFRNKGRFFDIGYGLIIGGSIGNLIDRLLRGYVVDYIDVRYFSVMNLADIMINVGILIMIWAYAIHPYINDRGGK